MKDWEGLLSYQMGMIYRTWMDSKTLVGLRMSQFRLKTLEVMVILDLEDWVSLVELRAMMRYWEVEKKWGILV